MSATVSPWMYSMAMYFMPPSSATSYTWTIDGWFSLAASRASSRNIDTTRGFSA